MSVCWGPKFPVETEGISPQTIRVVALAIADIVNDAHRNEFYASTTNLGIKIGCTRKTVRLVIQHLVERGVMAEVRRESGRPTTYRWLLGTPEELSTGTDDGSATRVEPTHPLGRTDPPPGYTSTHHKTNRYARETRGSGSSEDSGRRDYDIEAEEAAVIANRFGVNIDPDGEAPEWARAYGPHLDNDDTLTS